MSSAHAFGIWWFENDGSGKTFKYHLIDESYSQTHALEFVDINGDGQRDLVTGSGGGESLSPQSLGHPCRYLHTP